MNITAASVCLIFYEKDCNSDAHTRCLTSSVWAQVVLPTTSQCQTVSWEPNRAAG